MNPTRTRLVGLAAVLSAIAIAAPVSVAGAATAPTAATVIGPEIITTAPTTFINTNNQVSIGGNWSGGQVTP